MDFGIPCTYERPLRKRGGRRGARQGEQEPACQPGGEVAATTISPRPAHSEDDLQVGVTAQLSTPLDNNSWAITDPHYSSDSPLTPWKALAIACHSVVQELAQVYFEIVYPMYFSHSMSRESRL